jgi:hypothetical protein
MLSRSEGLEHKTGTFDSITYHTKTGRGFEDSTVLGRTTVGLSVVAVREAKAMWYERIIKHTIESQTVFA